MHFTLRGYPHIDFVLIFAYAWAPNCDALHPSRASTKLFCMDIYLRLSSEQWCTSPFEGIHKVILYWYLHIIELRTVMHFALQGCLQRDFVFIFTYGWAPNSDALHPPRVCTKWCCIDIYIPLSSEQWCTSPSEGIHKVILYWYLYTIGLRTVMHFTLQGYPQNDFCIDICIRLSSEQWCTSPSEGIHKVILYWYLHTIELRTVMHFPLRRTVHVLGLRAWKPPHVSGRGNLPRMKSAADIL